MISIFEYDPSRPDEVLPREDGRAGEVSAVVADIIATVRRDGDAALFAYAEKFDRVTLDSLEVTEADYWDGWIIFLYNGKAVEIETGSGDPDNVDAKPTVKITADMPCIVADRMSLEVNGNIVHYN